MSSKKTLALKISGESFSGSDAMIHDLNQINKIARAIKTIHDTGIRVIIILGGGNICRGGSLVKNNLLDRTVLDSIGMLGTLINALALQAILEKLAIPTRVQSAIKVDYICEPFIIRRAHRHLVKNRIVIFAAGIGNSFFSTDMASVLRSLEMQCECLLKVTKVAGVFSSDPIKDPYAKIYQQISYDEILEKNLKIMDMAAIALAKENSLPIKILSIDECENFLDIVHGRGNYTLIS